MLSSLTGNPQSPCPACPFCDEFAGEPGSVFSRLSGGTIPSRILHETGHFLVFPPLGEFVEGGLILASREHLLSMAHLPPSYYEELERLMKETSELLHKRYGCRPLFFEHSPVGAGTKGTCCVDHAHLNVFPVAVDVHPQLERFPHAAVVRMAELGEPPHRDRPYLFLQTNQGQRLVYDAGVVPSQYVRQIVTARLGMFERWHWRDYLGLEELKRTLQSLAGWRTGQ